MVSAPYSLTLCLVRAIHFFLDTLAERRLVEVLFALHPERNPQVDAEVVVQGFLQAFRIPLLVETAGRYVIADERVDDFFTDGRDRFFDLVGLHQLRALRINGHDADR